ncbi:hypothetical protein [Umezawaea beigongshangensis]|uniref:hypothetical protein n=1 Tax=Umezawaea beigongshangensis TaxID=2780383 RepID=UPI0018F19BED|nr:hypothetical protein [Umezawaea beigongshangensis]
MPVERRAHADHGPAFDDLLDSTTKGSPTLRWALDHGRYVTRAATSREFLAQYSNSHLRDGVAERISCPVLVCSADDDVDFAGDGATKPQPQALYDHLTAPAHPQNFTAAEGADAHCHAGAGPWRASSTGCDTTMGHTEHTISAQHEETA